MTAKQTPGSVEARVAAALAGFNPGDRHLAGVSGGRDSVVLLHLLLALGFKNLVVCHVDHGLRGRASKADAAFVGKLAKQHGLRFAMGKADVAVLAKRKKISIETAAREARYTFFARIAAARKCRAIFLGHHADDQVETFLFNLFRGAAAQGLGGMRFDTQRPAGRKTLRIVRPLLAIWRNEIDDYAAARRLKFHEDASNADTRHLRNRMRHEILPALEEWFGRDIKRSVRRSAEILADENEWLESLAGVPPKELRVRDLRKMPVAQQRRVIRAWLKSQQISDCGFAEVEAVRALLPVGTEVAKVNLPGNKHARRKEGRVFLDGLV